MSVDTKSVVGRRKVAYSSYDDLLADAEQLATTGDLTMVGNWTLGQIMEHLAVAFNGSIDGIDFKAPWIMRVVARMFLKKKFVRVAVPSGFKLSGKAASIFAPDQKTTTEEGLAKLRSAVERCKTASARAVHPVLGKLTSDEWDSFNLRHAEMHMSFATTPSDDLT